MALGRMITGFITVIVGASLVPSLVTILNSTTSELTKTATGNASQTGVALTNVSNTTLAIKTTYSTATCSNLAIVNATGGETIVAGGNYTFDGSACNFIFNSSSPYVNGTTSTGNLTHDYSYTYLNGTLNSANSMLELTILFFALGVMIAGVGTSVSGLVEYGLI